MSYYSNIRINMEANAFELFKKYLIDYLTKNQILDLYPFDDPDNKLDSFFSDKDHVYFGWDNYNHWDTEGVETDLSTGVIKALKKIKNDGFAYSYAREGEDVYNGDIVAESYPNKSHEYVESPSIEMSFDDEYLTGQKKKKYQVVSFTRDDHEITPISVISQTFLTETAAQDFMISKVKDLVIKYVIPENAFDDFVQRAKWQRERQYDLGTYIRKIYFNFATNIARIYAQDKTIYFQVLRVE